jgi:hypothetical protein
LWTKAINEADIMSFGKLEVPVIGRGRLVAMWLLAGRTKDYEKIASFWNANLIDMVKLRNILERHNLLLKWEREKKRFIDGEESR